MMNYILYAFCSLSGGVICGGLLYLYSLLHDLTKPKRKEGMLAFNWVFLYIVVPAGSIAGLIISLIHYK